MEDLKNVKFFLKNNMSWYATYNSYNCSNSSKNDSDKTAITSKQETLAQVFSCEFCEISKNTFFTVHLRATASVIIVVTPVKRTQIKPQ